MMHTDRAAFAKLLAGTMLAYGKPMPTGQLATFWWEQLTQFPLEVVERAMAGYRLEEPNFAPNPNAIIVRCVEADGRPSADEAWAIALQSCDEQVTVIWTVETCTALADCRTILDAGDKIGARRAFIESYTRAVLAARSKFQPAKWLASLGTNINERQRVLANAVSANKIKPDDSYLLPSPEPKPLLLPGVSAEAQRERWKANMDKIKKELAKLEPPDVKISRHRQERLAQQQDTDRKCKEKSAQIVARYTAKENANESIRSNREAASARY
jgi:hypothetical protein